MEKSFKLIREQLNNQKYGDINSGWDSFYRTFSREFKAYAQSLGCTDIQLKKSYFYCSGFFTASNGQPCYINFEDWRWMTGMYVRKVRDYKDYHGESNVHLSVTSLAEFKSDFKNFLRHYCKVGVVENIKQAA